MGRDYTLHAKVDGTVVFRNRRDDRTYVSIKPNDEALAATARPVLGTKEAKDFYANGANAPVAKKAAPVKSKKAAPKKQDAPQAENQATHAPADVVAAPVAKSEKDDLKKIEGIGPKIEGLLNEGGFLTFAALADGPTEKIQDILDAAGPRYRIHKPATWSEQAALARDGKWDELKVLQDRLDGGK